MCLLLRAVPDEKMWGSLKAKHFFVGMVGVGCFSILWVVLFCENVILYMVVLLNNAVLRISSFQMGSWRLFGLKYKE